MISYAVTPASVVVTGASGDVGGQCVELMLRYGINVVAVDVVSRPRSDGNAEHERSLPSAVLVAMAADVSDAETCSRMFAAATDLAQPVALINCLGVMSTDDGDLLEVRRDVWETTFNSNFVAVREACRAALPVFKRHSYGSIVNIASTVASRGSRVPLAAYTASKGAVLALTREIAVSYADAGVRANCVSPGPLDGRMLRHLQADALAHEARMAAIPMGRLGKPSEVAAVAAWLSSDQASYITGADIPVDGGLCARGT